MADKFPPYLTLKFFSPNHEPIKYVDLGREFLDSEGISKVGVDSDYSIKVPREKSKYNNFFYPCEKNGIPLPDGLNTILQVENAVISMQPPHTSGAGNPTRKGISEIVVGGTIYSVTAHITEGRKPFYLRVVARKKTVPRN